MISGGWAYVWPAYGVTIVALIVLAAIVVLRTRRWARAARDLDRP